MFWAFLGETHRVSESHETRVKGNKPLDSSEVALLCGVDELLARLQGRRCGVSRGLFSKLVDQVSVGDGDCTGPSRPTENFLCAILH